MLHPLPPLGDDLLRHASQADECTHGPAAAAAGDCLAQAGSEGGAVDDEFALRTWQQLSAAVQLPSDADFEYQYLVSTLDPTHTDTATEGVEPLLLAADRRDRAATQDEAASSRRTAAASDGAPPPAAASPLGGAGGHVSMQADAASDHAMTEYLDLPSPETQVGRPAVQPAAGACTAGHKIIMARASGGQPAWINIADLACRHAAEPALLACPSCLCCRQLCRAASAAASSKGASSATPPGSCAEWRPPQHRRWSRWSCRGLQTQRAAPAPPRPAPRWRPGRLPPRHSTATRCSRTAAAPARLDSLLRRRQGSRACASRGSDVTHW
jgi:hypothetical protein